MAFHSYTHLIQKLFNAYWCGPPSRVTGTSSWTCVDHLVSRLPPPTNALFRLAFTMARALSALARRRRQLVGSLCKRHAVTAHAAPTACRRTGSGTISLFSSKCFSPFPHGTGSLSVSLEYLALPDGPGGFAQDSSCPALLRMPLCHATLRLRGCHPLRPGFPAGPARVLCTTSRSYNPGGALPRSRFGLFPVRSPLLGESFVYFLFLRVLRCFSSPR